MRALTDDNRGKVAVALILLFVATGLVVHSWPRPSNSPAEVTATADPVACSADKLRELDYSQPGQGELAWADEFDGTTVDTGRWTVRDRTKLSFDQATILARNVSVRDGMLLIEARRESVRGRDFTTGYLDTIGHFSQQHGRWEIRARLPVKGGESRGLWPAFWLRANDHPGEIDVMEAWGTPADKRGTAPSRYAWNIHEDTMAAPGTGSGRFNGWGTTPGKASLADDFHVFAVDWSPDCLKFTLDGDVTGSVDMDAADWLAHSLSGPVNIRLNLQVGSRFWGRVDDGDPALTRLPAAYAVDHVRVYSPR